MIVLRQEGEEFKLKLADVHLALAEVSLESDQIEQAITDQNTCLQLREFILEPHDRRLAEVYVTLFAVCHSTTINDECNTYIRFSS